MSAALLEDAVVAAQGADRPRRRVTRWRRLLGFAVPLVLLGVWQVVASAELLSRWNRREGALIATDPIGGPTRTALAVTIYIYV